MSLSKTVMGFALLTLVASLLVVAPAAAKKDPPQPIVGTTDEQLAQLTLPAPEGIKVAILPFQAITLRPSHIEDCRDALITHFTNEGFDVVHPALVAAVTSDAVNGLEPGQPMQSADAVRAGERLGAKWAVYGTINECSTHTKNGLIVQRKSKAALQLNIVDVEQKKIIFWQQRNDIISGGWGSASPIFGKKKATLERAVLTKCTGNILSRFFAALPNHPKGQYTPEAFAFLDAEETGKAYQATPYQTSVALTHGQALLCSRSFQEALGLFRTLVASNAGDADVHFWHGAALLSTGATTEARAEWKSALSIKPDHPLAAQMMKSFAVAE